MGNQRERKIDRKSVLSGKKKKLLVKKFAKGWRGLICYGHPEKVRN